MSSTLTFEDQTQASDLPEGQITDSGIKKVDGITFSHVSVKFGDITRTSHQITIQEDDREIHFMPSLYENGMMRTTLVIVSEKRQIDDKLEFRSVIYDLEAGKLRKISDKKFRGTPKQLASYEETLQHAVSGKYREMHLEEVQRNTKS